MRYDYADGMNRSYPLLFLSFVHMLFMAVSPISVPSSTNLINALKLVPRPFIDASVFDFGGALAITPFLSRESYPLLPSLSQVDHSPLGAVPNARGRQKPAQR